MEQVLFQYEKVESEKHKSWGMPAEGFKAALPLTAPCWETLASGEHVVGQWYSWTTMRRWGPCMGCTARWKQILRFSDKSIGRLCAICGATNEWKAPQQVTGGTNRRQCQSAKGLQSACGCARFLRNLINALKLFANQQKDGDSPIESIVTGLCERSRKGIMEGLRNFIKVDNH